MKSLIHASALAFGLGLTGPSYAQDSAPPQAPMVPVFPLELSDSQSGDTCGVAVLVEFYPGNLSQQRATAVLHETMPTIAQGVADGISELASAVAPPSEGLSICQELANVDVDDMNDAFVARLIPSFLAAIAATPDFSSLDFGGVTVNYRIGDRIYMQDGTTYTIPGMEAAVNPPAP
ncbi:MAG: hypothetical protein GC136_07175 [Alphaproteobacteria bacterium]|nr:hypothetical protein [Alphaproteobacteria bacterium]